MAGGWDGVKLVLLFTSHSTIFKWFGAFLLALECQIYQRSFFPDVISFNIHVILLEPVNVITLR